MHWGWVALAGAVAAVLATFADWFFGGVWMHHRYNTYPEVWRPVDPGGGHSRAIGWSVVLTTLGSFGFVVLAAWLGLTGWGAALGLAAGVWLCVPLPMLITNTLFMRLDPLLLLPHGLGSLVKLLISAAAVAALAH